MRDPVETFFTIDETGYIWYPFIKSICNNKDIVNIHYKLGGSNTKDFVGNAAISPFLEYVPKTISASNDDDYSTVDVNPYFRFKKVFKDILNTENNLNYEILCDIIMHTLVNIDRICGMNRRDFLIMTIIDEIDEGYYGSEAVKLFNTVEKRFLAEVLIMFYNTSDSLSCLTALFKMILTDFQITLKDNEEFIFYNPDPFDKQKVEKIKFVIKLFLPIGFPYTIHWRYSYGYVGYSESMNCEEFVL